MPPRALQLSSVIGDQNTAESDGVPCGKISLRQEPDTLGVTLGWIKQTQITESYLGADLAWAILGFDTQLIEMALESKRQEAEVKRDKAESQGLSAEALRNRMLMYNKDIYVAMAGFSGSMKDVCTRKEMAFAIYRSEYNQTQNAVNGQKDPLASESYGKNFGENCKVQVDESVNRFCRIYWSSFADQHCK